MPQNGDGNGWPGRGPYGGRGQLPPGFPQEVNASLQLQQMQNVRQQPGVMNLPVPVMFPVPILPIGPGIARRVRRRVYTTSTTTAGTLIIAPFKFDQPSIVYALTGAAGYDDGEATNPNSLDTNPLDWFQVEFKHNQGDKIDSSAGLGSALVGSAERPAPVGGEGWYFKNGGTMNADITPRYSSITITIAVWLIEVLHGSSFQ